ncbi:hypothetical protein J8I87_13565 [Paraburkholderia sp. LEh10]|uniref:hypothetical protein n=1 Tax=Paraburkholderia sp. LEh10 TaxID=2821353 RepID=UPI001AE89882|nr:hypothetical protein [Paraburkholderia sp. LEh10]MBP0590727.1 hypothetical protein [Paraburkholderia sp. LEh10]
MPETIDWLSQLLQIITVTGESVALFESDAVVIGHRPRKGLARWLGERPVHNDLAEQLKGSTLITVTAA